MTGQTPASRRVMMETEGLYCVVFFVEGNYHVLCHEGKEYRFHTIKQYSDLKPAKLTYYEARNFIETHPVCTNISHHDIRIMPYGEVQNIMEGKPTASTLKSLVLSNEEEEEEPLH
jgi:hypothetical protein